MSRESNVQKAKEVRDAYMELAAEYVDATHIEVGEIMAKDDVKELLTIRVADANRFVPYQGHDTSEFTVGHFWAVVFDDLGTIRLAWWVSDAAGGGTRPVTPHDIDGAWHTDFLTIAQTWRWTTNDRISFRDAQIYVHSSADGVLHLEADGSITFGASIFPDAANVLDVGAATAEIHNLYMGDPGAIYWGLGQDVNLYRNAPNVLMTDDTFRATQAGIYISPDALARLHVAEDYGLCLVLIDTYSDTTTFRAPTIRLRKSHSDTIGTITETVDGEHLGDLMFYGVDTTPAFDLGAFIRVTQIGAANTRVPAQMFFYCYTATAARQLMVLDGPTGYVAFPSATSAASALIIGGDAALYRIAANVAGMASGDAFRAGNYMEIVDGIAAPGANVGFARIYVDTADGDLKVVFGDGFVATIAADS